MSKTIYVFDASGYFTQTALAQPSPLEPGKYIEPVQSTELPLPQLAAQQTAQFIAGAWQIVPDYRGLTVYDSATGAAQVWQVPGALPAGLQLTQPAPTNAQLWAIYQSSAKLALDATDITVNRVSEAISLGLTTATAADVVTFMQYRRALRAILSQAQPATIPAALPAKPAYPANT